jgi:hypothetical protein
MEWLGARMRAAFPGENVRVDPAVLEEGSVIEVQAVEDATWKAGIKA